MRSIVVVVMIGLMTGCESNRRPANDQARMSAAQAFTDHYKRNGLAPWHIRGHAAGSDCSVLFVETSIILEDSMVEALHYGAGAYDVYRGGVMQFSRQRAFRGVAYKDSTGKLWTFGDVRASEAAALEMCR